MNEPASTPLAPAIRRGLVKELKIYDVTEAELQQLERGSPGSILLDFAIGLLSIGASTLLTLLAVPIASSRVFTVYICVALITTISGTVCLVLWRRNHLSVRNIVTEIRSRIIPEGEPQS
jgi:hypothetical protein